MVVGHSDRVIAVTAAMARARHRGGAAVTYTTMPYYPMTYYHYDLPPTTLCSLCYPLPLVLPPTPQGEPAAARGECGQAGADLGRAGR